MKTGIIGAGRIGSVLYKKTVSLGWEIKFILKDDGVYRNLSERMDNLENRQNYFKDLDVVFLAIPTFDDGKTAFDYMTSLLEKNIPVVTCEKGSLSNYFSELEKWIDKIGYSATVGGGTRLLRYLERRINPQVNEVQAVINGTLNYIFDEISKGRNLGEVVEEVKRLGYTEPGASSPIDIINKESLGDAPMKSAILFNVCFRKFTPKRMKAKNVELNKIGKQELRNLITEANNRRYIVSITKGNNKEDVIGGFKYQIDDWTISAGFKRIDDNPLFRKLIPEGVDNAVLISEGEFGREGTYVLSGPGAGSGPTTNSMIIDAEAILLKRDS